VLKWTKKKEYWVPSLAIAKEAAASGDPETFQWVLKKNPRTFALTKHVAALGSLEILKNLNLQSSEIARLLQSACKSPRALEILLWMFAELDPVDPSWAALETKICVRGARPVGSPQVGPRARMPLGDRQLCPHGGPGGPRPPKMGERGGMPLL
jgi:hypothetical protein